MDFPSLKDAKGFDPEDPHDAMAEKIRSAIASAVAECEPDFTNTDNVSATITGLLVGVAGIAACCSKPESHREVAAVLASNMPWAMNMARSILGLPEITDQ